MTQFVVVGYDGSLYQRDSRGLGCCGGGTSAHACPLGACPRVADGEQPDGSLRAYAS